MIDQTSRSGPSSALEAGRRCRFRSRNLRGLPAGNQPKISEKRMQLLAIDRDSEPAAAGAGLRCEEVTCMLARSK